MSHKMGLSSDSSRRSISERRVLPFDMASLKAEAWIDLHRKGLASRLRHRLGRTSPDSGKLQSLSDRMAEAQQLVKGVMGTSGGDNARLASLMHARFDRAGLKQPSVEVRFENLCAEATVPQGATGGGIFTVGTDIRSKANNALAASTRSKQPTKTARILQNVSGALLPGTITLLVGPPGGGKSMLMKTLCGAAPVPTTGSITYNGHAWNEFNVVRTARYVEQHDLHIPELTVRETLMFSAMCQGPGYNPGLLELLEEREHKLGITPDPQLKQLMAGMHSTDPTVNVALTLQLLALTGCADTVVGDGMLRGISGGERKRVTSGEIMVGPSKVLFMDEISTGLDSASTHTIVQSLANWAHATDAIVVVALLQPEPEVYELFDDVMLVSNGRIVYHGPRPEVEPHFASLGFVPPPKKAVADFLQEVVSKKDQPLLRVDPTKFEPQLEFVHAAALAAAFQQSDIYARTRTLLATPFAKSKSHPASLLKSRYGVPGWEHVKALMWREAVLIARSNSSTTYRYVQMAILAFMVATLFLRGEVTDTDNVRGAANGLSAMFFSMAYMQFLGLGECAETILRLPMFYKQKYTLLFPGWAYALPFATIHIPRAVLEVTMWSLVVYWGVGFDPDVSRIFCFWGTLVSLQLYSASLYRMLGTTLRSIVFGTSAAVMIMLLTKLATGFLLLRDQLPPWWRWMFWVSPLQYTLTGLANNEFSGKSYDHFVPVDGVERRFGDVVLEQFQFNIGNKWRWLAPVVLLSWYLVLTGLNALALTKLSPPHMPPPGAPPEEPEYILHAPAHTTSVHADGGNTGGHSTADKFAEVTESEAAKSGHDGTPHTVAEDTIAEDTVVELPATAQPSAASKTLSFPFEPVTLAFKELKYFVPNPAGSGELQLLKSVSGVFRPGILTALMGASGAGKTTLMDVLADRKTVGRSEGKVTVNGHQKNAASFARVMGYCEQFDIHSPGLTAGESVHLSAALRLDADVAPHDRDKFVGQTLEVVELEGIAGQVVGVPGQFGLSGEQFKRLTIAVELVANPSILFMDEPTSGLDARAAQIVMRVVRAIGNNNRTIVCTIHQPSAEIFLNFDELLLLKRGGEQIFYGPLGVDSQNLVDYFQSVPGAKQLSAGHNPATYMLECSTRSEEERLEVDFAEVWRKRQRDTVMHAVEPFMAPVATTQPLHFKNRYAQTRFTQYRVLFARYFKSYWRSPPYNTTRLVLSLVAAVLLGTFYFSRGDKYGTPNDVVAVMGTLLISVLYLGFINFQMIIPTFTMERPVMWRERASAMYAVLPWVESMQDVEVPWVMVQVSLFSLVAYFLIGFEFDAGKFVFYWLALNLSCLSMVYFGMLVVCVTPNMQLAVVSGATVIGMWFVFAGFMIPRPVMPSWWRWFSYICPPGWTMYAIIASQLGDKDDLLVDDFDADGIDQQRSMKQFIKDEYDYEHSFRWPALGILLLFVVAMRLFVALSTKTIHWQKR